MEDLIPILVVLGILFIIITLVGHGIWLLLAWLFGALTGRERQEEGEPSSTRRFTALGESEREGAPFARPSTANESTAHPCSNCGQGLTVQLKYCGVCGARRPTLEQEEHLRELEITLRQLERLQKSGAMSEPDFGDLKTRIVSEREQILFPQGHPGAAKQPALFTPEATPQEKAAPPATPEPTPPRSVTEPPAATRSPEGESRPAGEWTRDSDEVPPTAHIHPPAPRKPFAEVLASFMEQSNIRWGEIIGGLLIIGCSTALVVSLWAQISRVPTVKFLIFTTVTAALFGIGFYTEHHWKLPTTSRGILTIATLLVPLNFLAIAAVSSNATPLGATVIVGEIIAPAIFLCLIYFAGRVITPAWPHLLAAGALGSSVGQLLIRHLASPENSATLLILLAAFPIICYVVATGWMLKIALADGEIDDDEASAIFITLGTLTFAAVLPIALLLYKVESMANALMYIAPLITLGGAPLLATGMLLWQRARKALVATRTAGAAIAILGAAIAVAGMFLAWPNPASIVPAALFNFALFTAIAIFLDEPRAHVIAGGCLAFGFLVAVHVVLGNVPWQNLRVTSLLRVMLSARSGQALAIPFVAFALVNEWFRRKPKPRDAFSYLLVACGVASASLLFLAVYGIGPPADPFHISAIVLAYAAGAFWFAWREKFVAFAWAGSVLLFLASAQVCHSLLSARFPWESSFLLFAMATVIGTLALRQFAHADVERWLVGPLRKSATIGSVVASLFLLAAIIWNGFEPSSLFATHAFILAGVMLGLLILTHASYFFVAFQLALTLGAILFTKFFLQRFDWYAFRPDAWLHPWALQTQGVVLGLLCLAWIAFRMFARRRLATRAVDPEKERSWVARIVLDLPVAFDHVLAGMLVIGFIALIVLGAASGISKELTSPARTPLVFDLAGFPHQMIFGIGALALLGILLAVMLGNLRERQAKIFGLGALLVLWTACPLVAGRFESQFATASAARWSVATFLLATAIAFSFSTRLAAAKKADEDLMMGGFVLLITLGPLILLTLSPLIDDINYVPARGPQAGVFQAMGSVALYGIPLILAVIALGLNGWRERSASFVFAAGLLVNFTVTSVLIVSVAAINGPMNRVLLVKALQLNAIAAASVALAWMATRAWWMKTDPPLRDERILLTFQKFIAITFVAFFIAPIGLRLIALPDQAGTGTFAAGRFEGWLALLLVIAFASAFDKLFSRTLSVTLLALSLLAAGSLMAFGVAEFGVAGWAGFHVLLAALIFIPWLLVFARDLPKFLRVDEQKPRVRFWQRLGLSLSADWERDTVLFASIIGGAAVLVGLRGPFSDPQGAWWSIAALLTMCGLAAALHWITLRRAYLYAAGILVNVSLSVWLIKYRGHQIDDVAAFFKANVIALSLAGIVWLMLELRARRLKPGSDTAGSFHNVAALISLLAIVAVVAISLLFDIFGFQQTPSPILDWAAVFALAALMFACLWDRDAAYAVAGLYLAGLLLIGNFLDHLQLAPERLIWSLMIAGAAYLLTTAAIWRARAAVLSWASRLKIPLRIEATVTELKWLNIFTGVVAVGIIIISFRSDLTFADWWLRATAAVAVALTGFTFVLMAEGKLRRTWQRAAVIMFLTGTVLLGWSLLIPGTSGTWLNRAVIVMSLMFAAVALFGAGLDRFVEREPDWSQAFRDCVPAMTVAAILSLVFVLTTEVFYQVEFGIVRVSFLAVAAVALTLAAAVVVLIFFAVSPRHDPLALSENWRGSYVYVAEVTLVLLFMHIRLTMPWLFGGFFQRYWPLVVLAIAYAGVAVSEFLKRRNVQVLAQPIERTGAFLPLLPVIGFWIAQSQVEYSTLLFVVGGLYGLLSILRRSFWFGLAAALAGNGGLWYLLHETSDYHFFQHPQAWLIPVALSVLIAAYLNRKDFSPAQMTTIRYLCLITIYVSSTADIFINGVARSPWLPLVLAALSIAGVFAGIIFRVQAFLLLGSTFLLLAIATMINYASVNFHWTWLWYVAGIVVGAAIIATFAVFEKKRAEVLRVVDELKDWKG
jgi:hypothetical protein